MFLGALRAEVLDCARSMVADGLAHRAQGNISALDPASGLIAITPSAILYCDMTIEDIVVIEPDGKVVEGRWRPTSEVAMHTIFYRRRPDVRAVVHSHAPYASIFAVTNAAIPPVLIESAIELGGPVRVAPYRRPGTRDLAEIALETIGDGSAVLLAQHGLLTVGPTLSLAYEASLAAEMTARVVYMARAMHAEPISIPPEEVRLMRRAFLENYHPTLVTS